MSADRTSAKAVFRIPWDVLVYRLRKLEMANLAGALAIMLVLRLDLQAIALRGMAALLLNLLVYLNNDYYDVRDDLEATGRDRERTLFLAEHLREALIAQGLLAALLVATALLAGGGLIWVVSAGALICWAYSARLKRAPFVDVIAMILWGGVMPLCGVPIDSMLGIGMAGQLALYSGVFETVQVRRDREEDMAAGVRTTAVVLGDAPTMAITRTLIVASALYGVAILHPVAGVSLVALFVGRSSEPETHWTRVKLVLGLVWLASCVLLFVDQSSSGMLVQIPLGNGE